MRDILIVDQFENMIINVFGMHSDFIILYVSTMMEVPLLRLQIGPCLKCIGFPGFYLVNLSTQPSALLFKPTLLPPKLRVPSILHHWNWFKPVPFLTTTTVSSDAEMEVEGQMAQGENSRWSGSSLLCSCSWSWNSIWRTLQRQLPVQVSISPFILTFQPSVRSLLMYPQNPHQRSHPPSSTGSLGSHTDKWYDIVDLDYEFGLATTWTKHRSFSAHNLNFESNSNTPLNLNHAVQDGGLSAGTNSHLFPGWGWGMLMGEGLRCWRRGRGEGFVW